MAYVELERLGHEPHECRTLIPEDEDAWINNLGNLYRRLRATTRTSPVEVLLDGVTVASSDEVHRRIAAARLPASTGPSSFDVVRADVGEMTAYNILEDEYRVAIVHYPIVDREVPEQPSRGLDAVAVSREGELVVYVGEAKVSSERASPPAVVEANTDSLWNQHTDTFVVNLPLAIDKFWNAFAKCTDQQVADRLAAAAVYLEKQRMDRVRLVAFSCMVRSRESYAATDFGPFFGRPDELSPAVSYFAIVLFSCSIGSLRERVLAVARAESDG